MKPVEEIKYPIQKEMERFEEKFKDSVLSQGSATQQNYVLYWQGKGNRCDRCLCSLLQKWFRMVDSTSARIVVLLLLS